MWKRFSIAVGIVIVLSACSMFAQPQPKLPAEPTPIPSPLVMPIASPTVASPLAAPTVERPGISTRNPNASPPPAPTFSAPTANAGERLAASQTWLYLTAFQSHNVSIIDPLNGHVLREFPVAGDQPGMAVAPDGTRLYVVDGDADGELRIYETKNGQVIYRAAIGNRALLLGGNPIALSGNGRWLVVAHYSYQTRLGWSTVFDTERLLSPPNDALPLRDCTESYLATPLMGRQGHSRLYANCNGFIVALDAATLSELWQVPAPTAVKPACALAPEGSRLYCLYPRVGDLRLQVWETATGKASQELLLGARISIPMPTIGRGEGGYLALSPDGARLYIAWEDRLWALASDSLQVLGELQLPTPTDGLISSIDGREVYLLPATAGDLTRHERGLWTVDAATLKLTRHATEWPVYTLPFFFAAPAPKQ